MTAHAVTPRTESRVAPAAVLAGVLAAAGAGWLVLAHRMAGMDMGPGGDPGALGWFAATWAVMTVAMMLPASPRAVLRLPQAAVLPFLTAYVAVWTVAGLAGWAFVEAMRALHIGVLGWSEAGRYLAGAAVVAAGLYQLTGAKRRWLARCAVPHLALRRGGGAGGLGAAVAGVQHAGCCMACCATLMASLYALGIMSIAWMVVVTVLIAAERLLPRPAFTVPAVGAVLIVLGVAVAAVPAAVPALTIPAPMPMAMSAP
jgi:predicted metal-binding membrane protein